ncbi:non-lysosomal glucosylceramidase [Rhabdobacter roseus]|uniref:Uncharacterized protein (DUF608 family) n=1 Tax=Rhabdobacter roseus TaxID=1655419 RepID=A0A840TIQ9_9BACT|nr:GH116 family glycosyl-hydrolase [Rhabdobacter roseus]MBB5284066.1 uncharacterized protein (DUF608 family) [Rhabdobacter roseus]
MNTTSDASDPQRVKRRDFLKTTGLLATGLFSYRLPVVAGPFRPEDWRVDQVPVDKKLDPAWVKSLYERGAVTTYYKSKNELQFIGMPVGGIHTGTVYLGGDGRLWLWDIFNQNQEGINPKEIYLGQQKVRSRDGSAYVEPARDIRPLEQGFAIRLDYDGKSVVRQFRADDWAEIAFEATYPIATLHYTDPALPVAVRLEAYSPFIPLDEANSGLPATIFSFSVTNTSESTVQVTLLGWLENKAALYSGQEATHQRINAAYEARGFRAVVEEARTQAGTSEALTQQPDYGNFCLAFLGRKAEVLTDLALPVTADSFTAKATAPTVRNLSEAAVGAVRTSYRLRPGQQADTQAVLSWYFPNLSFKPIKDTGRFYANDFGSAREVAQYIQQHFKKLAGLSHRWKQTWYDDTTLPWWFQERTFVNLSTLATTTCHRLASGRFYAWEGVGCCPGTCTHVWQYAQGVGRIFPALERDTRERVDLGVGFTESDGKIAFRAEADKRPAVDGQAGTILRIYREHQMSADDQFLRRNWDKVKKALEYLIQLDRNQDGMQDTPLENTLDAVWDGEIAWIVGLCIAAVRAGQAMGEDLGDAAFAERCRSYVEKGRRNMETHLFNGEYFIHRPDPEKGRKRLGSYNTSHIDQVYGQSWAFQVGLGRILDQEKTVSALRSLWKYNFTPDVGPYISEHKGGRPYALAGDGGMIMNTNPKNEARPYGEDVTWQLGYFHECMSGFEHQVASHLMAEGLLDEALVLTRSIHDRYHAAKRNPFNEIECSDHYARALASYGTFLMACGFAYHGPKGEMAFAPRWSAADFRAPFTAATGWGSYAQAKTTAGQTHTLEVRYGTLSLRTLRLELLDDRPVTVATTRRGRKKVPVQVQQEGTSVRLHWPEGLVLQTNQVLTITL